MMNLTTESEMLEEKEEKQLEVYGQQKGHDHDSGDEWEKGDDKGGGGTDDDEEEAEEEESEEEETSGIDIIIQQPTRSYCS